MKLYFLKRIIPIQRASSAYKSNAINIYTLIGREYDSKDIDGIIMKSPISQASIQTQRGGAY
ncbi:hypothetical protein BU586_08705 [Staphylococcus agnetis]|nr:hypothetical protein BU586_08705 [Staphylococcus agnetis]PTH77010.1 hypothetical protein BU579_06405 [Staphylococcus agnetis]